MHALQNSVLAFTALALMALPGCTSTGVAPPARVPVAADAGFERATPESVGMSTPRLQRLDDQLDAYVEGGRLPGYQLLVSRRGKLVHERLTGSLELESGRPLAADTIYRIYSMSKVITGIATMIGYEQGLFLLGEPVSRYLPALARLNVMYWAPDGSTRIETARNEISILDLLRHTSGITYSFLAPPPLRAQYLEASLTPGIRGLPDDTELGPAGKDREADLGDMLERLGALPLVAEPGTEWHYGINMDVLGRLIEVTSGQSFPDFLQTHLFEPLGMRDTAFFVPDEKIERFAACYGPAADGGMRLLDAPHTSEYRVPPAMPGGGGGLVSTARDYMRFAQMLANDGELDGVRVLSRKTVDLIMANHTPAELFGTRPLGSAGSRSFANGGFGVGFGLTGSVIVDAASTGLPISEGSFGWGGAASTYFWVDRKEELAVVFMTQLVLSGSYPLRAQLMSGVNSAIID